MRTRFIITLLLVVALFLTGTARPSSASKSLRFDDEDEQQLLSRDAQEARELATRFSERLRETNDFGQIVDELFVKDFPARLQQSDGSMLPLNLLGKGLIKEASPGELRRYYVAALNFFSLFYKLAEASAHPKKKAENGEAEDGGVEMNFEDALSPEIMAVLERDPTLALVIQEIKKDEEDDGAKENDDRDQPAPGGDSTQAASATTKNDDAADDDDDSTEKNELEIIKSLAQLNGVSGTLEKAIELMRHRLASLLAVASAEPKDAAKAKPDPPDVNSVVSDEVYFGYPKGTTFIHLDILPFCLTMTRIDGQLKISSVAIFVD